MPSLSICTDFLGKGDFEGEGIMIGGCAERNTSGQVETNLVRQELGGAGRVRIVSPWQL